MPPKPSINVADGLLEPSQDQQRAIKENINRYLSTGESDPFCTAWPGRDAMERIQRGCAELRDALTQEVKRLAKDRSHRPIPAGDTIELTRRKVAPMVRGLFPRAERETVLTVLERSVLFVTSENIERLLQENAWSGSAWTLANLYLGSVGAKPLAGGEGMLLGSSEHMTCYVSPEYFREDDLFADYLVHEAAHVFHNCKRHTIGLRETRKRVWLLDIDFSRRETFAYSCEFYSRILERAGSRTERLGLADQLAARIRLSDNNADSREVASIVKAATAARNGWKVILARCGPTEVKPVALSAPAF